TIVNPGPLYHNAPFTQTHRALFRGDTVVGMARFDPEETLRLIAEHRARWINMVPTMMLRIWRLPHDVRIRYDLSSLTHVWHMAAPMPPWLKEAWIDWLGPERIWEFYGGTEGQGATVISGTEWLSHRGSVGRPVLSEMRILDEAGEPLPTGAVGEIYMRPLSGNATYHYLGAEARSAAEGFESIGDFGWMDADGYLYLADRRTDLILSGGANIYPAEVEAALMEHPDVEVAVVVGLPDEDLGAAVHAIVKPQTGASLDEASLAAFVAERLARYKTPRSYEFTGEALRDDAGKVRRNRLRDERIRAAT
ncbi:MAG TPA: AMP-binding protein, partial [Caulobacteraceae bacterium]|nr:AMP-binding protein [Caulobacteraceae bacterium]